MTTLCHTAVVENALLGSHFPHWNDWRWCDSILQWEKTSKWSICCCLKRIVTRMWNALSQRFSLPQKFHSSLICLCSPYLCRPYYLWSSLSGREYLIMLKRSTFWFLKGFILSPFPSPCSYIIICMIFNFGWEVKICSSYKNLKILNVSWPFLLTHPHTDRHLFVLFV